MTRCYFARGFYNQETKLTILTSGANCTSRTWPGPALLGGPLIIGTELLLPSPLNYSILVRPPPAQSPHTVLMDILIGFGHNVFLLQQSPVVKI